MGIENEKRVVKDFWHAVNVSFTVCFINFIILSGILFYVGENKLLVLPFNLMIQTLFVAVISILLMIRTYTVYIQGISLIGDEFSWPASDVENSFLDLITLKRLRGFFYREKINAIGIEYVTNDFGYTGEKGAKRRVYSLNISGNFGSRNIRFNSKQKRDEARNILKSFSKTRIEADIAFN